MLRTISRATLATLAALAGPAFAQSSVTVAGIADAAARHVSNQGLCSAKSLTSGNNRSRRLIVRGVEDLDGGLWAIFWPEHGLLLDNGSAAQSTQLWDRRSTVGLASKTLGGVRAGSGFVPSYVTWSRYDRFSHVGAGGSNNFASAPPNGPIRSAFGNSPNTTVRSGHAIQVLLPGGLGGAEGGAPVAAGEGGTAANGQHKTTGVRVGGADGGTGISAASTTAENDPTTSSKFKDTALGGQATFGSLRLTAAWRRLERASAKQTHAMLGAIDTLAQHEFKFAYRKARMAGSVGATNGDANDATQQGLGYAYNLSKRSALYTHYARISNKGAATFVVPGGAAGMADGKTSTGTELGLRHARTRPAPCVLIEANKECTWTS